MAHQIGWKELESRLENATIAWDPSAQSVTQKQPRIVPVYVCWPPEMASQQKKEPGLGKTFAALAGILAGGLMLGLLLARLMLPW